MVGDCFVALLLLVVDIGFLEFVLEDDWSAAVLLNVVAVAPLTIRRKHPLWFAYLALPLGLLQGTLAVGVSGIIVNAIAVYTLVVYTGRRSGVVYLLLLIAISSIQLVTGGPQDGENNATTLILTVSFAFCWVLGEFVSARRAYHAEVEARLHLLETERDQATRIAVAQERSRISRELHDVVAHAVSVIVVQADGASYAVRSNPELAERAVRTISETGRGALAELRRLLDVLRNDDDQEPRVPQPTAGSLAELAERMTAAGLPVSVDLDKDLDRLPTGVSLGVYRIVQESLTNVLKHAGPQARATVSVRLEESEVEVEVLDNGRGPSLVGTRTRVNGTTGLTTALPGGNGLIGMRERANVLGGRLTAGPRPGGGWRVHARIPVRLET
ncbi:sensor histidine kinase [Amycolatopsis suaedae]|uniref:histidine kinase n=2 Tax=Amycolatopsis suaedae TaxID=2510978 RepID=A0A4Q7JED1_9PSEU|nr:histidine kinase [Amycolatopsis suaedae]RZQ65446.1 sensor histidine kinase [Amycolatopsis suaedae]